MRSLLNILGKIIQFVGFYGAIACILYSLYRLFSDSRNQSLKYILILTNGIVCFIVLTLVKGIIIEVYYMTENTVVPEVLQRNVWLTYISSIYATMILYWIAKNITLKTMLALNILLASIYPLLDYFHFTFTGSSIFLDFTGDTSKYTRFIAYFNEYYYSIYNPFSTIIVPILLLLFIKYINKRKSSISA